MTRENLKALRQFYKKLERANAPARLIRTTDGLGDWQQIITIRHARPDLEKKRRYTAAEAHQYTQDYDEAPIIPFHQKTFVIEPGEIREVYTSNLKRSVETAIGLFGEQMPLSSSPLFRELERQVPQIFGERKFSKPLWSALYRGQYFLGRSYPHIESFSEARARLREAGAFLEQQARQQGAAVVVAHGLFNFFLGIILQNRKWKKVKSSGANYLGVSIYVKQIRGKAGQ